MKKLVTTLFAASICASALAAPAQAAKKKGAAKKCSGEFMYVDKKSGKCMDARDKKG